MQAVVVLTAASVCTLKHPCAQEQDLNLITHQRALRLEAKRFRARIIYLIRNQKLLTSKTVI